MAFAISLNLWYRQIEHYVTKLKNAEHLIGECYSKQKEIKFPIPFINVIGKISEKRHAAIYEFFRLAVVTWF